MKKLLFIILLLITLTSCGRWRTEPADDYKMGGVLYSPFGYYKTYIPRNVIDTSNHFNKK